MQSDSVKVYGGYTISNSLVWAGKKSKQIKAVLDELGHTPEASIKLKSLGIDPERYIAATLVRVKIENGKHLRRFPIVSVTCSIAQLCTQPINKNNAVIFVAQGIQQWRPADPETGFKGDGQMSNGTKIYKPFGLVPDSLVLDMREEQPIELLNLEIDDKTDSGFAQRVGEIREMLAEDFQEEVQTNSTGFFKSKQQLEREAQADEARQKAMKSAIETIENGD